MTAATATKPRAKATPAPISPKSMSWRDLFPLVAAKSSLLLWTVHRLLEEDCAESAYRLSAIAARMFDGLTIDAGTDMAVADEVVYDSLALIDSAMTTDGERIDAFCLSLLDHTQHLVRCLMFAMSEKPSADQVADVLSALAMRGIGA